MYIKLDDVSIKRILLDLHDVIVDSEKVVLFECEWSLILNWKLVDAGSKIWKQSNGLFH